MINLLYCDVSNFKGVPVEGYLEVLPAFMRHEVLRYNYEVDRLGRLISRLMLLSVLREASLEYLINDIARNENTKPYIPGWLSFNISHSQEMVVFVHSAVAVGVDIEEKKVFDFSEVMGYFHPLEKEYIAKSEDQIDSFYKVWVKKEALLKAIGVGLVNGLDRICVLGDHIDLQEGKWSFKEVYLNSNYCCYVCAEETSFDVESKEFEPRVFLL